MVVQDDRRRQHHADLVGRWPQHREDAVVHAGFRQRPRPLRRVQQGEEPPVLHLEQLVRGHERVPQPGGPVRAGGALRGGAVLDADGDHGDGVRRLGVLHPGDHADPHRLPGPHQTAHDTALVAQLLGLGAPVHLEGPVGRFGRHIERDLLFPGLVPRDVGRLADVQRADRLEGVTDPALHGALLHLEEPSDQAHRRLSAVDEHLAGVRRTLARVECHDRLGHQHPPLPAHHVLRRAGPVGVEHVALVEHRVGHAARRLERRWCGHPSASSSRAVTVASQPTWPRRPR